MLLPAQAVIVSKAQVKKRARHAGSPFTAVTRVISFWQHMGCTGYMDCKGYRLSLHMDYKGCKGYRLLQHTGCRDYTGCKGYRPLQHTGCKDYMGCKGYRHLQRMGYKGCKDYMH